MQSHETNGAALNILPGQVICLDASIQYGNLVFSHINGTPENPVVITNCGGKARIYSTTAYGVKFTHSKNFILTGNGDGEEYGIVISSEKGFNLTMELFTSDFEIRHVEIAGPRPNGVGDLAGFAGIGVKTSPYQDCELFKDPTRQAWIMRNVSIHNNYIHDTGGEGLYIGHGFYSGRIEQHCPDSTYAHSIKGLRVYENIIENVGYDGIQVKNADEDVQVYYNIIRNYGCRKVRTQNQGLFIGEGTTGEFYGNIIDTGSGNGCMIQGLGNLDVCNNIFIHSGENGLFASSGPFGDRLPGGYFNICNNTIFDSTDGGFVFYSDEGGPKSVHNNLIVQAGQDLWKTNAKISKSNNILSDSPQLVDLIRHAHFRSGETGVQDDMLASNPLYLWYLNPERNPFRPEAAPR